jgi:hypothetical protein
VIGFNGLISVNVFDWLPCVVAIGPTRPLDQILEFSEPSMTLVADDVLHFKLLVSIDKVRWGLSKVGFVDGVFIIG